MRISARSFGGRAIVAAALCLGLIMSAAPAHAEEDPENPIEEVLDDILVIVTRVLSAAEVLALDVTDSLLGQEALAEAAASGMDVYSVPHSVYEYDGATLVAPTGAEVRAFDGENAAGETVSTLAVVAAEGAEPTDPGLAVPPKSAFGYNNSGNWQYTTDDWIRKGWWNITTARWRPNTSSAWKRYTRFTNKTNGGLLDTSGSGFRRLWAEVDRTSSGSYSEFEPPTPASGIAGAADTTTTIGYSAGVSITLGAPPIAVSGSADTSYTGSVTSSTQWWHPVNRAEVGSGGVQWCHYPSSGYQQANKVIAGRVSLSRADNATAPGWTILHGMSASNSNCPDV
ncbi:hypothetical protein HNR19_000295 [Nocardioides thalensis]|uniref:Uncharacterized protein n=1 Tax=Nocardioides thalensis TaxID=1914755 RepID=A0A853BXM7_9ACTN|nr:hypothetical protein [Nocardioides thalensis]NYI99596.1 hypothetical protein [Nocardioides thalensis]